MSHRQLDLLRLPAAGGLLPAMFRFQPQPITPWSRHQDRYVLWWCALSKNMEKNVEKNVKNVEGLKKVEKKVGKKWTPTFSFFQFRLGQATKKSE